MSAAPCSTPAPPGSIAGTVVRGRGLGRMLGAATANLALPPDRNIPYGSWAASVRVRGRPYHALAHVGVRPSIGGDGPVLEVHLLDFDGDLYGTVMRVRLLRRVAEELTLPLDALRYKIAADVRHVRAFFRRYGRRRAWSATARSRRRR